MAYKNPKDPRLKENNKRWRQKNPDWWKKKKRRNNTTYLREIIVDFLVKRDGLICGLCKQSLENSKIHLDHIKPVALGGENIMENIQLAHPECNLKDAHKIRKEALGY